VSTTIGVLGATGTTGSLLARVLAARGFEVVLAAREPGPLVALAAATGASWQALDLRHRTSLRATLARAPTWINAVGPYLRTGEPVARAACAVGVDLLDLSAERPWVARCFSHLDGPARDAGVRLVPAAALLGACTGALALRAAEGLGPLRRLDVAGLGHWRSLSGGSRRTLRRLALSPRFSLSTPRVRRVTFDGTGASRVAIGIRAVEQVLVPRLLEVETVGTWVAIGSPGRREGGTPPPFELLAEAVGLDGRRRRACVRAGCPYRASARVAADVAVALVERRPPPGVHAAAALVAPSALLAAVS